MPSHGKIAGFISIFGKESIIVASSSLDFDKCGEGSDLRDSGWTIQTRMVLCKNANRN
jgi:hypothetical protein